MPAPTPEEDRAHARRIVRAHSHGGHGSKPKDTCPWCRDLVDVITLALAVAHARGREEALEEAPPQATLEKKPEEPLTRVTVTGKKVPAPSGPPPAQVNPAPGGLQGRI